MSTKLQQDLTRRLLHSVANLHKDIEKVEFWASAITGFAEPVPSYEPESIKLARYLRPGRPARKRRPRARRKGVTPASA